jgi:ASC-1-like (ASCH) protein
MMPRTKTLWLKADYLQHVLSGRKTVEVRVAYANIARLQPGDVLWLNEQHRYTIIAIRRYADFEAMAAAEEPGRIAPELPDRAALLAACRALYPPDKEALGVVALEITPAADL